MIPKPIFCAVNPISGLTTDLKDGLVPVAPVKKNSRSMMNVTFVTGDADLDKKFASEAAKAGLKNLKGHRSVGGMRASIYNAMPIEGVQKLVAFMEQFEKENR